MGLCKCPKRKVTNLFCFEHRVNVCEFCLLANHESCVVQTYLSWLTDSDYDVNCPLCFEPLTIRETIRLKCLHLFHWDCLDARVRQLPDTTAPAGFKCPSCLECIFPRENQQSPIVDRLINKLQTVNWGRNGLGMSYLPELDQKIKINSSALTSTKQDIVSSVIHNNNITGNVDYLNEIQNNNVFTARSKLLPELNNNNNNNGGLTSSIYIGNEDDSKYAKKAEYGIRSRFARLPRSFKRILLFLFILLIGYYFLSIFLFDGEKEEINKNKNIMPIFDDPHANPNVRVENNG